MSHDPFTGKEAPGRSCVSVDRRQILHAAVGATTAGIAGSLASGTLHAADRAVKNGRINQSVVYWCFNAAGDKWDIEKTCQVAVALGCKSVELVEISDFPVLKKHGLVCALTPCGMPDPPFAKGYNNTAYHDEVISRTKQAIDACADAGFPSVIGFNGYKWRDADDPTSGEISLEEGADNCVDGLKKIAGYAEKQQVNICVEMLNTRDDTHPMKGHPGYQGDDIDYVADIIRRVGSPRVQLLFDIYHVQVMNGDVMRRLEQNKDIVGHVHTAGNPGRGELDTQQEIQYSACMQKLLDIGYDGFVGQEFIPTRDPLTGLHEAVSLCDV